MRQFLQIAALGMTVMVMCSTQAGEKEMVIDAAGLAPAELRSDEPVSGKWWLRRDAPNGMILMTGRADGAGSPRL